MIFREGHAEGGREMRNQFPTTQSKSRRAVEAFAVASKCVLVADEDPALLRRVTETIDRNGFRAVPACNGREALKILQRDSDFVAAIFAVAMSDLLGPELVRYMKTEKRLMHIPIILMSSQRNPTLSADAFSAGAQVFLPKPFTPSQLLAMLHMLIGEGKARKRG
jgi:PleD family two-component response regulator